MDVCDALSPGKSCYIYTVRAVPLAPPGPSEVLEISARDRRLDSAVWRRIRDCRPFWPLLTSCPSTRRTCGTRAGPNLLEPVYRHARAVGGIRGQGVETASISTVVDRRCRWDGRHARPGRAPCFCRRSPGGPEALRHKGGGALSPEFPAGFGSAHVFLAQKLANTVGPAGRTSPAGRGGRPPPAGRAPTAARRSSSGVPSRTSGVPLLFVGD